MAYRWSKCLATCLIAVGAVGSLSASAQEDAGAWAKKKPRMSDFYAQ